MNLWEICYNTKRSICSLEICREEYADETSGDMRSSSKLSNSCFSFITQHSTSLISCENEPQRVKKCLPAVRLFLKKKKKSVTSSPPLLSISSFSVLLGNAAVIFPDYFKELLGCVKEGRIVKGWCGRESLILWTKH